MAWFVTRSLLVILATFGLGLVIGWLWWGRAWRRVPFGESGAVRAVSERYETAIAERDAELVRLANDHAAHADGAAPEAAGRAGPSPIADAAAPPGTVRVADPGVGDGAGPHPGSGLHDGTDPQDGADSHHGTDSQDGTDRHDGTDPGAGASAGDDGPTGEPAEPAEPDDLQRIEGVGPRIAAALTGAGLSTYRDVAEADEERLTAALRDAGLAFAPSLLTWPRQARLLADGDEEGLSAVKAGLTAGRARPPRPAPMPTLEQVDDTGSPDQDSAPPADLAADAPVAVTGTSTQPDTETHAETSTEEPEEGELERVEGIGPRIATALRRAGIHTYRQLAAADAPTLQAALLASGLRFAPSLPTWSRQAALLVEGDEAGFLALTRTLVPDRESGRQP